MAEHAWQQPDSMEMAVEVLAKLSIFDKAGVASRARFDGAPESVHPKNLMADFASIIAYAQDKGGNNDQAAMAIFDDVLGVITAQDAVIRYLRGLGYRAELILPTELAVSLPRIAEQAGLGEVSPVRALFTEEFGLNTRLGAIITNAPLTPSKMVQDGCTECWACVDVCPAADDPYEMDPERCTGCGECVTECPFSS